MRAAEAQGGFSLAEVVVALGVLASVLISVAGMLVAANRLVRGGRGSSQALALARDFMEEQHAWGYRQILSVLDCEPSDDACFLDDTDPALASWKAMLTGELDGGTAAVRVESVEPGVPLGTTEAMRLSITVTWVQDHRVRDLTLGTVRM
jgi:type II secretory pathway pseudopilin PulG